MTEHLKLANRCKNEGREVSPQIVERLDRVLQAANLESSPEVNLEQHFRHLTPIDEKIAISEPITWGEYHLFLAGQKTGQFHSSAKIREIPPEQYRQPVEGISPQDARWFCAWLSTQTNLQEENALYHYRLPSEEELQKAGGHRGITLNTAHPGDALRVVREEIPNRYQALLNYLANGRWREADEETANVMLAVAGPKERGYLRSEDIDNFPCEDLRTIDRLWLKFSGERFGFSVQKEIYERLGGTREYNPEIWERFCEEVGWMREGERMDYSKLTFSLVAPSSHLPALGGFYWGRERVVLVVFSSLAQRLVTCKISTRPAKINS